MKMRDIMRILESVGILEGRAFETDKGRVIEQPMNAQFWTLLRKSEYESLRGLFVGQFCSTPPGKLFVWDAEQATHGDMEICHFILKRSKSDRPAVYRMTNLRVFSNKSKMTQSLAVCMLDGT